MNILFLMRCIVFFYCLLIGLRVDLFSQKNLHASPANRDSLQGEEYFAKAFESYQKEDFLSAIPVFEQAGVFFKKANLKEYYIVIHTYLAISHSRLDQEQQFLKYESDLSPYLDIPNFSIPPILIVMGIGHVKNGESQAAKLYFERAVSLAKQTQNLVALGDALQEKGELLIDQGALEEALDLYFDMSSIFISMLEEDSTYATLVFHSYNSRRHIEQKRANFSAAKYYFHKAKDLLSQHKTARSNLLEQRLYNGVATIYLDLNLPDSALLYLRKKREIETAQSLKTGNTFNHRGVAHTQLGNFEKAKEDLLKAKRIRYKSFPYKHDSRALVLSALGDLYQAQNQSDSALYFQQAALRELVASFESEDVYALPPLTGIDYKITFLETLLKKAEAFQTKYEQKQVKQDLEAAYQTCLLAADWVDTLRSQYFLEGSRLSLSRKAKQAYQMGMEYGYELYQQSGEDHYLEELFRLSEKSKGLLLMEAFQASKAKELPNLPQDSLAKEQELVRKLTFLETRLHQAKRNHRSEEDQLKISQQIFEARQQMQQLNAYFEARSPEYQRIRQTEVLSLSATQRALTSEQGLVEYFLTPQHIYAFLITEGQVSLHQLKRDFPLIQSVEELRHGIYGYHTAELIDQTDSLKALTAAQYRHQGHQLYQQLLADVLSNDQLPEQLIIIPDGVLGYVPFDALLREPVQEGQSYGNYPYLMQKHQISYCYSASLLQEMKSRQTHPTEHKVLAIGISFQANLLQELDAYIKKNLRNMDLRSGKATAFPAISYATREVNGLVDILPSDLLTDSSATETALRAVLNRYQALHFSTHGILDSESEFSFLALANSSPQHEEDRLYVKEIYGLDLQADMVFLSACETGLGKLQEGEGIISLARGFSYAGAKSIITTLWSISDQHSSWIVHRFYGYIDQGLAKDEALQRAKQDYIQEHAATGGAEQHPFYWAAFTPIGDMAAVEFGRPWLWNLVMVTGFLLIVLLLWRRKRKNFLTGNS